MTYGVQQNRYHPLDSRFMRTKITPSRRSCHSCRCVRSRTRASVDRAVRDLLCRYAYDADDQLLKELGVPADWVYEAKVGGGASLKQPLCWLCTFLLFILCLCISAFVDDCFCWSHFRYMYMKHHHRGGLGYLTISCVGVRKRFLECEGISFSFP